MTPPADLPPDAAALLERVAQAICKGAGVTDGNSDWRLWENEARGALAEVAAGLDDLPAFARHVDIGQAGNSLAALLRALAPFAAKEKHDAE